MTLLTRNGSPLVLSDSLDGLLPDLRKGDVITWPYQFPESATVTRVERIKGEPRAYLHFPKPPSYQ